MKPNREREMTLLSQKRLNKKETAEFFGVADKTITKWRDAGVMPRPMRLGLSEYWLESQLEAWVAEQNPHLVNDQQTATK